MMGAVFFGFDGDFDGVGAGTPEFAICKGSENEEEEGGGRRVVTTTTSSTNTFPTVFQCTGEVGTHGQSIA